MKLYLECLIAVLLTIICIGLFAAPIAIPILLLILCDASAWWFLLTLLYIPYIATIVYIVNVD